MYTFRENSLIAYKWLTSFTSSDWTVDDYPVRVRPNGKNPPAGWQWIAQIMNWGGPNGHGATINEAKADLATNLQSIRKHRQSMPRPGSHVPIEFAPSTQVNSNAAMRDDFITRVLGFASPRAVFISDQSSLHDFGDEAVVSRLKDRIMEVYGTDVSDLKDAYLVDILERIGRKGKAQE